MLSEILTSELLRDAQVLAVLDSLERNFDNYDLIEVASEKLSVDIICMGCFDEVMESKTPYELVKIVKASKNFDEHDPFFTYTERCSWDELDSGEVLDLVDPEDLWNYSDLDERIDETQKWIEVDEMIDNLYRTSGDEERDDAVCLLADTIRRIAKNQAFTGCDYSDKVRDRLEHALRTLEVIAIGCEDILLLKRTYALKAKYDLYFDSGDK